MKYYAHSRLNGDKTEYQELSEHLANVGTIAETFTRKFSCKGIGQTLGLLHDAGKYSVSFQKRITLGGDKVDHSTAGAKIANERFPYGKILAYAISGHHGGMPDGLKEMGGSSSLISRLSKSIDDYKMFFNEIELPEAQELIRLAKTIFPGFSIAFMTRMLFSSLVDADYLDTERYVSDLKALKRSGWNTLDKSYSNYKSYIRELNKDGENVGIDEIRRRINDRCIETATQEKGIYSLTVPTGGGKTLASMGFALEHAKHHDIERIIYAIPYTSIIEQNAEVFRKALGDSAVLEHHSNIDYSKFEKTEFEKTEFEETEKEKYKLASENWDAPIVVTTNVQFFESLFSNKPSKCRKLHNIANSIIILDEVQTIPDELLKPCLMALQCLVRDYGSTVVLCTATQPALDFAWPEVQDVREIIQNPVELFNELKRVEVIKTTIMGNEELVDRLAEEKQALCIVNTKKRARDIFEAVKHGTNAYHLSTYMCPAHRSRVLCEIKKKLKEDEHCIVISTQLIEAGVDIDFPVVFRDIAGIDSIAQAAGRCNREGKLDRGYVYIVRPEDALPKGHFQRQAELGESICRLFDNILAPEAVKEFFKKRYRDGGDKGLDKKEIIEAFNDGVHGLDFPFSSMAKEFNFIKSATESIVIPYDENCRLLIKKSKLRYGHSVDMSQFQRYIINLYSKEISNLRSRGFLNENLLPCPVLEVSDADFCNVYSNETGIKTDNDMETLFY